MNKKKTTVLVMVVLLMIIASTLLMKNDIRAKLSEHRSIAAPDSIIYYKKDGRITLTKSDYRFYSIVSITNERVKGIKDMAPSIFMLDDLKKKGTLLEFDYSEKQTFKYAVRPNELRTVTYTKLYFDLDKNDSKSDQMDFEGEGYGPIGPLLRDDKLLDILNK
ncbi:hypothetical protein JHL18_17035 [Clostridium sp. YIM B02505]|uniref:DUF4825 domain-containing protein n=1 Tax=Clostridium yunnanense TaxID=2800325 RepID=A0ABS1ESI5_9CLOT|nr:hypothetical protein [Clostridium yunnanense]MBK1812331.1 hypothetical protein [Clostridium yunnanense]